MLVLSSSLYLVSSVSSLWPLFFHFLLLTHTSNIWRADCFLFFIGLSFPFFIHLRNLFQSLIYTPLSLNSFSPNFLLTILPVCNLIIPTTTLLKTCSCKSHQHPLDCPSQGPLFLSHLSSLLDLTPLTSTSLKFLAFFLSLYLSLFLVLDIALLLSSSFRSTFQFCLKSTSCTSHRYST